MSFVLLKSVYKNIPHNHGNRIHSSFTSDHRFDDGYVEKQPAGKNTVKSAGKRISSKASKARIDALAATLLLK